MAVPPVLSSTSEVPSREPQQVAAASGLRFHSGRKSHSVHLGESMCTSGQQLVLTVRKIGDPPSFGSHEVITIGPGPGLRVILGKKGRYPAAEGRQRSRHRWPPQWHQHGLLAGAAACPEARAYTGRCGANLEPKRPRAKATRVRTPPGPRRLAGLRVARYHRTCQWTQEDPQT
jgi:hypothetical protein